MSEQQSGGDVREGPAGPAQAEPVGTGPKGSVDPAGQAGGAGPGKDQRPGAGGRGAGAGDRRDDGDADLRDGDDVERDAEDGPIPELLDVTGDDRGTRTITGLQRLPSEE